MRTKMTFVALAVTLVSSVTFAIASYMRSLTSDRAAVLTRLEQAAEYSAERLTYVLDLLEADAFALSQPPELSALLSQASDATGQGARLELEQDFLNLMTVRQSYAQIRLIGVGGDWPELVRVDRTETGLDVRRDAQLLPRVGEPFLAGIEGAQPGSSYYYDVTQYREFGRVQGPPALRLVRPIFGPGDNPIAALVINADFEKLLEWAVPHVPVDTRILVVNSRLDYMVFDDIPTRPKLRFHKSADWLPPPRLSLFATAPGDPEIGAFSVMREGVAMAHLPITDWRKENVSNPLHAPGHGAAQLNGVTAPRARLPFQIRLIVEMPREKVYARAQEILSRNIVTALLLAMVTVLLALALGGRVLAPLSGLADTIKNHTDKTQPIVFTATSQDEIGELANELTTLSNDLICETRRLDSILMTAADAIVTIDSTGNIIEANKATEHLFGYSQDELIGRPLSQLMFPADADAHPQYVASASPGSGPRPMGAERELYGRHKSGQPISVEVSVSSADVGGARYFIGIIRDVTERRKAQEALANLVRELERSNSELDQFAYIASHDLKAPLRVIDNASRWLEEDLREHLDDDTRESMDLLRSRVARMERLLDDLLQHSRIGRIAPPSTVVAGAELIDEIRILAGSPDKFTLRCSDAMAQVVVQRMPLQTVLLNLVSNGIKHHDRDHANVMIDVQEAPDADIFIVEDDGPGIPPQYHEKVFELFQTLQPRDRVDSSGMGLAMVRKHVEVVGGTIELISDGSRGTTFRLHWPRNRQHNRDAAA